MFDPTVTDEAYREFVNSHQYLKDFAAKYRDDPELRARVDGGDLSELSAPLGLDEHSQLEFRVAANTPEVHHVLMPADPVDILSDETLINVTGGTGTTASTAGTVGSAGSMVTSTTPSSFSSAGSAGSAGTAA